MVFENPRLIFLDFSKFFLCLDFLFSEFSRKLRDSPRISPLSWADQMNREDSEVVAIMNEKSDHSDQVGIGQNESF